MGPQAQEEQAQEEHFNTKITTIKTMKLFNLTIPFTNKEITDKNMENVN